MFNRTKAVTNLTGLVGFQNPTNPSYEEVSSDNQVSRSGRNYTDNPYCKIEFLKDNFDYADNTTDDFNTELTKISNQAIVHILDKVFDRPDYIDRQLLYQFANNKINTDSLPADNFVGYRIETALDPDTAFKFTRILLEFEGTGDLTLYLFHSSEKNPIKIQVVTIASTNQSLDLKDSNWVIDYSDVAYYKGDFYIGYLANEAIAAGLTPIKRDYQSANSISVITFLNFERIKVPGVTTAQLWDLEDIESAEECWGLNPDVSVYDDYTDIITQNENLFSRAIQLQGQINALSLILSSRRSNANERLSKEMASRIMAELEGIVGTNKRGLKSELRQELDTLRKEVKKLSDGYFVNGFALNTLK
jgi:hypothetical protein